MFLRHKNMNEIVNVINFNINFFLKMNKYFYLKGNCSIDFLLFNSHGRKGLTKLVFCQVCLNFFILQLKLFDLLFLFLD